MNILHLSPYVPDVKTNHAGGVCMGKEVETLKEKHQVTVLTFCNNEKEMQLLQHHPDYYYVKSFSDGYIWRVLKRLYLPNLFALRADRKAWKMMLTIIKEKKIDAIHAEYTSMGQYWRIKKKYPNVIFNLVEHDVTTQSYERQHAGAEGLKKVYLWLELKKVYFFEKRYIYKSDAVFTLNEKDRKYLHERFNYDKAISIHPYYGIDYSGVMKSYEKEKAICFVGNMQRSENGIAAMRLIRLYKELGRTDWKLRIIGANPSEELKKEASDTIEITGYVEDINAEICKCRLAVFPLTYGAGIKLKVLLAFGLGLPVVTSSIGAEGIDPEGNVLLLAETDDDFKQQMIRLMDDDEFAQKKGIEGAKFVNHYFDWSDTEEKLAKAYAGRKERA